MVFAQTRVSPWEWDAQNSLGFKETNNSLNLGQKTRPSNNSNFKKQNLPNSRRCRPGGPQNENQRNEKSDKNLDLARELKKAMEHEGDGDTNCNWCTWNDLQRLGKGLEKLKIGGRAITIKTSALMRSVRKLRSFQEI